VSESGQPSEQPHSDAEIVERIDALLAEEKELEHRSPGGLSPDDASRQREIQIERDRLWDLKRAREARRNAGEDPDEATERPADVVENYRQ
jgi:hypothetical protein